LPAFYRLEREADPAGKPTGSARIPYSRVDSPHPIMEMLSCVGTGPPHVKWMPQGDPVTAPNLPPPSQDIIDKVMSVEGAITAQEAQLLYTAAQTVRDGCIVEIGSHLGRSTAALALGTRAGFYVPVYAIDPHENFRGILASNFNFGPSDRTRFMQNMLQVEVTEIVRLVNLSSEYITASWPDAVALLWIDGDHRYKAVKRDVTCWFPHLRPDATIIFHDATNPQIGPLHVIEELLATGQWDRGVAVDKAVSAPQTASS
jgi:predicted O-methyltransferase YrrM